MRVKERLNTSNKVQHFLTLHLAVVFRSQTFKIITVKTKYKTKSIRVEKACGQIQEIRS